MSTSKPYWIICSKKKNNAIWQHPYFDFHEAQRELIHQRSLLSPEQLAKSDWQVETRWRLVDEEQIEKEEALKTFDNF